MTVQSSWICPACGNREMYSDSEDYPYHDLWMTCRCPKCSCEFMVNVTSTEYVEEENELPKAIDANE